MLTALRLPQNVVCFALIACPAFAQSSDLHLDIQGLSGSTLGSSALQNSPNLTRPAPLLLNRQHPLATNPPQSLADQQLLARLKRERDNERRWAALHLFQVSISGLFLVLTEVDPNGWDTNAEDTLREAREHAAYLADLNKQICELEKTGICGGVIPKIVASPHFQVQPSDGTAHWDIPSAPAGPGCVDSSVGTACPVH